MQSTIEELVLEQRSGDSEIHHTLGWMGGLCLKSLLQLFASEREQTQLMQTDFSTLFLLFTYLFF